MNAKMILAVFVVCAPCAAQEANLKTLLAQTDPDIQERIGMIVDILNQSNLDPRSNYRAVRDAQSLKELVADPAEIVNQVAIFAASPAAREGRPLEARAVLEVLNMPPKLIVRVLAPYLNVENKNLRSFVRDWFQSHDSCGNGAALQALNYQDYLDYVRRQRNTNQEIPTAFIEYLYKRSPERALIVFYHAARQDDMTDRLMEMRRKLEADQRERERRGESTVPLPPMKNPPEGPPRHREDAPPREILLAEHIVSTAIWLKKHHFDQELQEALPQAKAQLSELATGQQWWVRLYVAEIMRRYVELRQTEVLEKLSRDTNALVGKSAKSAMD
jgi:hypothetical protein